MARSPGRAARSPGRAARSPAREHIASLNAASPDVASPDDASPAGDDEQQSALLLKIVEDTLVNEPSPRRHPNVRHLVSQIRTRLRAETAKRQLKLQKRLRRKITGRDDLRVRDHVHERLDLVRAMILDGVSERVDHVRELIHEPPAIRLRDKVSFLCGVVGCAVVEAVVLVAPSRFGDCYASLALPLLAARLHIYVGLGWHYFLLDFCYFVNLLCLLQYWLHPTSHELLVANFMIANGPLAMAIPAWRNSLVFHSLDKVTSVFVHALPPLFVYCMRWHPPAGLEPQEGLDAAHALGLALAAYLFWQLAYLVLVEVGCAAALARNPHHLSSIRWLCTPAAPGKPPPRCYSGLTLVAYRACAAVGLMADGELFDAARWKTKWIFVGAQVRRDRAL